MPVKSRLATAKSSRLNKPKEEEEKGKVMRRKQKSPLPCIIALFLLVSGSLFFYFLLVSNDQHSNQSGKKDKEKRTDKEEDENEKCFLPPKIPQDRRTNKNKLTIVTYNSEWLFLKGGRGNLVKCPSPNCPWRDAQQAHAHLESIARVLESLDADIINLQEVEGCGTLEELRKAMRNGEEYRVYMREGTDTALGQNVAMLTRIDPSNALERTEYRAKLPVPNSTCKIRKKGSSGTSKHYATQFNIPGLSKPLIFVGTHLVARPDDPTRCATREGQAAVLVRLVKDRRQGDEDVHVIVAGDFNDYDARVERLRRRNMHPESSTLELLYRELGLTNAIMASARPPPEWFSLAFTDEAQRRKRQVLIDHIMVSPGLFPLITEMDVIVEAKGVSDHLPLKLVIDLDRLNKPHAK